MTKTPVHVIARAQARDARLRKIGYKNYADYIASEAWKELKQRYRASGRPIMCPCGATTDMHFHHVTYDRVGGDELLDDLQPMCKTCHVDAHVLERQEIIDLRLTGLYDLEKGRKNRLRRLEREAELRAEPITDLREALTTLRQAVETFDNIVRASNDQELLKTVRTITRGMNTMDRKVASRQDDADALIRREA